MYLRKKILTIVLNLMRIFFLDKHAPLKKKLLGTNHASFVSKSSQKTILRRSYLEKGYFTNCIENS